MHARTLATRLKSLGVVVTGAEEADDCCDAAVYLTGGFHVQLSGGLMLLNQWDDAGDTLYHLGFFRAVEPLVLAVRKYLTTTQVGELR